MTELNDALMLTKVNFYFVLPKIWIIISTYLENDRKNKQQIRCLAASMTLHEKIPVTYGEKLSEMRRGTQTGGSPTPRSKRIIQIC